MALYNLKLIYHHFSTPRFTAVIQAKYTFVPHKFRFRIYYTGIFIGTSCCLMITCHLLKAIVNSETVCFTRIFETSHILNCAESCKKAFNSTGQLSDNELTLNMDRSHQSCRSRNVLTDRKAY